MADAGVRLRIIADGMYALGKAAQELSDSSEGESWLELARHVDEVRVRLCALPLEAEGEA